MTRQSLISTRIHHAALTAALVAILAGAACAPQGSQPSPELAAMSDRWVEALAAGDIDGMVGLYTADCRIMPPNAPMIEGRDAVRSSFSELMDAGITGEIKTIESTVAGDIGYKIGTYTLIAPDGSVVAKGKFSESWKKTSAGWQMSSDMFSSDLPNPGPGPMVVATHKVEDAAAWLAAWNGESGRHAMFSANGVASSRTMQNPEEPNDVAIIFEVSDLNAFMAFVDSPETQAAKAEDGVIEEGLRFYVEKE